MFARILLAIDDMDECQDVLELVKNVAAEGVTEVRALHLRVARAVRLPVGTRPRPADQASLVAEAAAFELRMAGLAVGGTVRHAAVDRVAQAILAEAKAFDAQLDRAGQAAPRRGARAPVRERHPSGYPAFQMPGHRSATAARRHPAARRVGFSAGAILLTGRSYWRTPLAGVLPGNGPPMTYVITAPCIDVTGQDLSLRMPGRPATARRAGHGKLRAGVAPGGPAHRHSLPGHSGGAAARGTLFVSAPQALPAGWGRRPGRGMARAGGR